MKWSVRGACAALAACLLLACALGAAAVGLRCFSLGSELRGEPFRLGAAAGAFYSGLLLAAGLALLGAALLRRGPRAAPPAGPGRGLGVPAAAEPEGPRRGRNLLLLGALVFALGVLSAFAGAVIDGGAASLAERTHSHHCRSPRAPAAAPRPGPAPGPAPAAARAPPAKCRRLRDYRRGLVLSTVLNALECLLGLLGLLLARTCRAARARRGRRGGSGLRARRGRRLQRHRPAEAAAPAPEESGLAAPGGCAGFAARRAVSCTRVGAARAPGEAGVEACCGGHPSAELPGYAPSDPDLDASYPYCCRPPREPSRAC